MTTRSKALDALYRDLPELRSLTERAALERVAGGLRTCAPAVRQLASFAGRRAEELGCASRGPVEVAPGSWAYRSADGRTQIWHRRPTDSEMRAFNGARSATRTSARPAARTRSRASAASTVKLSPAAARVGRIFK